MCLQTDTGLVLEGNIRPDFICKLLNSWESIVQKRLFGTSRGIILQLKQ
jgi:hypothetical protein